jgi:hypothetical protein
MKIMVSAIALSVFGVGAALAAPLSTLEQQRVLQVVPEANLTVLSDEQASRLSAFVAAEDFARDPAAADFIRAVLNGQVTAEAMAPVALSPIDAERVTILVPGAELSKLTAEQARMLSSFVNSAHYAQSPSAEAYVTAVLMGELTMTPEAPGMLSTSDAEKVRFLAPDANLTGLTEEQVTQISAFVNSADYGRNPGDAEFLRSILNS